MIWCYFMQLQQIYRMKLRAQRVHHMGASNRDLESFGQTAKNVFQNSYIKSQSQYYKTAQSLPHASQSSTVRKNPFQGTHVEQESLRWNSKAKKTGTETEWKLSPSVQQLDYSGLLNQEVAELSSEFEGKNVNMFKLKELKRNFVKNNRKRRNMEGYFQTFAKEGKVGVQEMKQLVRQYGYDITDDEAKLIFRLTGSQQDGLALGKFVELMTKDNVHFRTLKLNGAFGQPRNHFDESTHLVLRNKFDKLKQAFKIYRMRDEPVDQEKFNYVMKKLDINDLVISKEQRKEIFERFNENNHGFNVERLLCSIVEQEGTKKPSYPPKLSNFEDNLRANEQEQARRTKKGAYFDFKRMSNLQYEHQLKKAQQVQKELCKIPQAKQLVAKKGGILSKTAVRNEVESLLQSKGINFSQQEYDCFISYLDFNSNNQISNKQFQEFLTEPPKKAEQRFERRIRALPPKPSNQQVDYDQAAALESLSKVKAKQLDTEMRVLFRQFDKDRDGFVSRAELKDKISDLAVLQNWQVQNLANYFDSSGNGYVTFKDFASKYTNGDRQPDNPTEPTVKSKSQSEWISTKRSFIKDTNTYHYNIPTKYSAWPERLKRTDFSMVQPPAKAGQYISEDQRFNFNQKHSFAQQMKQQKNRIYENRLRKLVAWNELNQQRVNNTEMKEQQRHQANDYLLRLTKQNYEQHCHK